MKKDMKKIIFSLWFVIFAAIFAYVAIFKSDIIWLPTKQTGIALWKNALDEVSEMDSTIIQICLFLNSVAYLVNAIFFVLLLREKSNRVSLVITVIAAILAGVVVNYLVSKYSPWTPPCMIMLTNFLITTVLLFFLNKVKR